MVVGVKRNDDKGDRGVDWIKIPSKVGEDVCVILFGVNPGAVRGAWSPVCRW
jgi:hypothetical protein